MPIVSRWRPRLAASTSVAIAASAALSLCATAYAEPAPPYIDLLHSAASAPRLAVAAAETRRAEGFARQAAARPNPTISLGSENFSGAGPYRSFDGAETTLQASLPLELGGQRAARVVAGRAEVDAARARAKQAQADFAFDLAMAYASAEAADLRVGRAEDDVTSARDDARAARALVDAGREAKLRGLQSEAALGAAQAELDGARAARDTAFARLGALSAFPRPITSIARSLLNRDQEPARSASAFDPLDSPPYLAALAEREAAARRVRVEQTRAIPDVTASLGLRRFEADRSTAAVAGLAIPFPLFDRNRGNIDAARAALQIADARLEEARLEAEAEGRSALSQLAASQARLDATLASEQTSMEAYRLSRIGYESGKTSLLELLNARRAVGAARGASIDARLARTAADAALARLQGRIPFGDTQ